MLFGVFLLSTPDYFMAAKAITEAYKSLPDLVSAIKSYFVVKNAYEKVLN